MKKNLFLIRIFIVLFFVNHLFNNDARSQQDYQDSCLTLIWEHLPEKNYFNPDSVLFDTCLCSRAEWYLCDYLYARQWFNIILPNGAINLPAYGGDTTIYITWEDINTNFADLRQDFIEMESIFGDYVIKKKFPEDIDSLSLGSKLFKIKFDDYCIIDSVEYFLNEMNDLDDSWYEDRYDRKQPNSVIEMININDIIIYPNPANDNIDVKVAEGWEIVIFNTMGISVGFYNSVPLQTRIDISRLPSGMYFVRIGEKYLKFVKM